MRKLICHFQVSVDGFMSGLNGEMDWTGDHHDEAMWADVNALMATTDTVLFGRLTYELFESYWPHASANPASTQGDLGFAAWIERTPKIVFSRTLTATTWANSRVVKDLVGEVTCLKAQTGKNLLMFGSTTAVSALANAGLVDELHVNVHPVVLGQGKPFLSSLVATRKLELLETKRINAAVVGLRYAVRTT